MIHQSRTHRVAKKALSPSPVIARAAFTSQRDVGWLVFPVQCIDNLVIEPVCDCWLIMITKSREYIYGSTIRQCAERAAARWEADRPAWLGMELPNAGLQRLCLTLAVNW
jgi:hypothetical protein